MAMPSTNEFHLKGLSSAVLSSIFVDLEMRNAGAVEGRYAVSELEDIRFVRAMSRGGSYEVQRRDWHIAAARTCSFFACLPLKGEIRLRQDESNCVLGPMDIGFVDSRREYTVEIRSSNVDALWVRMDAASLDWRLPKNPDVFARCIDGTSGIGMLASSFLKSAAVQTRQLPLESRKFVASMVSDLLAEVASQVSGGKIDGGAFRTGSQRTLERVRVYVDQHLDEENLSPSRIASAIGISPRYLGQLFAAEGQTTMGWVSRRRLERCRLRLSKEVWRPGLITELAFASGFSNVSSFNRAFKAAFGMTPRDTMLPNHG
jgi:AraC family transcriptional regulator, positive regulator of tynA and feaB